jgi:hypothetical protein
MRNPPKEIHFRLHALGGEKLKEGKMLLRDVVQKVVALLQHCKNGKGKAICLNSKAILDIIQKAVV